MPWANVGSVRAVLTSDRQTDVNPATKEVRIAGTKTGGRDRLVRVKDALWPIFWKHARTILSGPVFPSTWNRWTVSDWHRHAVRDGEKDTHGQEIREPLKLAPCLPLRKARHSFAVRLLQAGTPIKIVADQMGSDERTILKHYGPWIVSADDRAKWEKVAGKHETKRRRAN